MAQSQIGLLLIGKHAVPLYSTDLLRPEPPGRKKTNRLQKDKKADTMTKTKERTVPIGRAVLDPFGYK